MDYHVTVVKFNKTQIINLYDNENFGLLTILYDECSNTKNDSGRVVKNSSDSISQYHVRMPKGSMSINDY